MFVTMIVSIYECCGLKIFFTSWVPPLFIKFKKVGSVTQKEVVVSEEVARDGSVKLRLKIYHMQGSHRVVKLLANII